MWETAMPKAWTVDGLAADQPLSHGAAQVLAVKLPEVLSYEAAARTGDVDGIHDMRVAAKRLREAVRVLKPALPEAARKRVLKQVELLNDTLGLVRDRDVLGEAFGAVRQRDPRTTPLDGLCSHLAQERGVYHRDLLKFLRRLGHDGFAGFYAGAMTEMAALPAAGQVSIISFAHGAIGTRLADVVENWNAALRPWEVEAFHRQRIRVKKLKYAVEPFTTLLPAALTPIYDHIADLQELMGLVHDCDVQQEVLDFWVAEHGTAPAYSVVEEHIATQRRRALTKLRVLLETMAAESWAARLEAILEASVAPAVPA
jgi:CHAD domain-containing protein